MFTNIPGKEKYRVDISGVVKAIPMGVLEVKPRKIVLDGELKINVPKSFTLSITNTGDADMEVNKIVSKKRKIVFYDANKKGKLIIHPGKTQTIKAIVTADKKGRMLDYVMVHSNARNVTKKGYKVILIGTFE